MLKGCTAEYLVERCARVEAGQTVLVHAAAGGMGSILVPVAEGDRSDGDRPCRRQPQGGAGRRSSAPTTALCCPMDALAAEVRALTDGQGVPVVLDGVGAASWKASLGSVARRGLLVTFGNASGPVPPFTAHRPAQRRLGLRHPADPGRLLQDAPRRWRASAARLFEMVEKGAVTIRIGATFPLLKAADAHRAIEARATTGSTVLIP